MIKIGFLYTRLRAEEKYLLEELEKRPNVEVVRIKDDDQFFDISSIPEPVDVLFERSVSYSRGMYISKIYEANGVKVVNSSAGGGTLRRQICHQPDPRPERNPNSQSADGFRRRIRSGGGGCDGLSVCAQARRRFVGTSARQSGQPSHGGILDRTQSFAGSQSSGFLHSGIHQQTRA